VGDYKEAFNWAYQSDFDPTGGDGKYQFSVLEFGVLYNQTLLI
jgi:hypothetical protein